MDEIRELTNNDKKRFSLRIYSERLLTLKARCSEDGTLAQATGEMYFKESISSWIVEYLCPLDGETFRTWTPEIDRLTKQIAKDVLEK